MVNVSSPGWDTVIVSKRNRNEYDSPQSTRRTQSFNLLFIRMSKRKIFSVSSVLLCGELDSFLHSFLIFNLSSRFLPDGNSLAAKIRF